jgi:dGTPase
VDVLERDGRGLNLTWETRDGIAKHSKGKLGTPLAEGPEHGATTLEGQIARLADLIAYVNHDIDDAVRAGLLKESALPAHIVSALGESSSARIGRMVKDVVFETLSVDLREIRMSAPVLAATLELRSFLFGAVYENELSTAEFGKAAGILRGLWEKVHERPEEYLDRGTMETEGVDAAARDFLAGMTDQYAVALFERLFIPKPWAEVPRPWEDRTE